MRLRAVDMLISTKNRLYINYKYADYWSRSVACPYVIGSKTKNKPLLGVGRLGAADTKAVRSGTCRGTCKICPAKKRRQSKTQFIVIPDWLTSYFQTVEGTNKSKCNLCEETLDADIKSPDLFEHLKAQHKVIFDLHESNPESNTGFRIEFLNFSMMKEDEFKDKPIVLEEMIGATETVQDIIDPPAENTDEVGLQYVLIERRKKKRVLQGSVESRKRSWVWKYFVKLSSILYRCNLCNVLLSIKGCNTNNMNRHIRTRHPVEFSREMSKIDCGGLEVSDDTETPYAIKTEEIYASDSLDKSKTEKESNTPRRSWVWSYFERITSTQAKCNICKRNISHGGNATGNMNRHLKMIHNKTGSDDAENSWVWKVMETNDDDDSYTCKICQYNKKKLSDPTKNMSFILQHLKYVHGVESGDQIITGSDWTP